MFNNVPNPPKFSKKIIFNLKQLLISVSDIMWFSIITAIFIPIIATINIMALQISLALFYIFLELIVLWRWEGVWLRDLIWVMLKNIFIQKEIFDDKAKTLTFIGNYQDGYFKKDNIYSKYYEIQSSDISLIRDEELNSRIECLNNFFMFSENVKFTLFSIDQQIDINQDLNTIISNKNIKNELYELLNFDKYNNLLKIQNENLTQKQYFLKISSTKKQFIDKAASTANIRIANANINISEAKLDEIKLIYSKIFFKKISDKKLNETTNNKNIYTNIKKISFSSSFYKIFYKNKDSNEFNKKYYHIVTIKNYPKYASFKWMNFLYNIDDLTIVNKFKINNIKEAKTFINNTTRFLKLKFDNKTRDMIEENQTISYYEQMQETADWISNGNSSLLNSYMFIIVSANKKKELDKKVGILKELCNSYQIKIDTLKFLQKDAFLELIGD